MVADGGGNMGRRNAFGVFFKMFNNGRDIKRPVAVGFQDAYQLNSIDLKEMNNFSGSGHLAIDDQYEKPQQYLPLDMKVA